MRGSGVLTGARIAEVLGRLRARIGPKAVELLGADQAELFVARLENDLPDILGPLDLVYGGARDVEAVIRDALVIGLRAAADRSPDLRRLDQRREIDPQWFQRSRAVGYVCYVDRFAGTVAGVAGHLDYLEELGVSYLHLMPLLRARPGDNDGGYAVADYRTVEPRLGTMDDLEALAAALRARGMSLCIDIVLNHTAAEHEWARRAVAGDRRYRDYYLVFPDRTEPDEYERSLRDVFPATAPGSFTEVDGLGWVWTSFHPYQWDLDYRNPAVFLEMLDTMLALANRGVDVFRLDAVPFLWKRKGTDCQNQPEAHALLQAFRALVRMAAPAVVFKAEAIVPPSQLAQYLGAHDRFTPECDLAYNNQLMVLLWSGLAERDARLMTTALGRLRQPPPSTTWVTYVRCHDDIGWAVSDEDAGDVGLSGAAHRAFLSDFYAGRFPGSFARGAPFQEDPATGDARTSGTAASLCGIEEALALGDAALLDRAVRRLVLLHSVAFSYGGIPLLYMGDELALRNDFGYLSDPERAPDNRWMHRPPMDWAAAANRHDRATLEGTVFTWFRRLVRARRDCLALRGGGRFVPLDAGDPAVLAYLRRHARSGPFVALVNLADDERTADAGALRAAGVDPLVATAVLGSDLDPDGGILLDGDRITLRPVSFVWLTGP